MYIQYKHLECRDQLEKDLHAVHKFLHKSTFFLISNVIYIYVI